MDIIKEAMIIWGKVLKLTLGNRTMYYDYRWYVSEENMNCKERSLYEGDVFNTAFSHLLGTIVLQGTQK